MPKNICAGTKTIGYDFSPSQLVHHVRVNSSNAIYECPVCGNYAPVKWLTGEKYKILRHPG